jgi:hypothetical protein
MHPPRQSAAATRNPLAPSLVRPAATGFHFPQPNARIHPSLSSKDPRIPLLCSILLPLTDRARQEQERRRPQWAVPRCAVERIHIRQDCSGSLWCVSSLGIMRPTKKSSTIHRECAAHSSASPNMLSGPFNRVSDKPEALLGRCDGFEIDPPTVIQRAFLSISICGAVWVPLPNDSCVDHRPGS